MRTLLFLVVCLLLANLVMGAQTTRFELSGRLNEGGLMFGEPGWTKWQMGNSFSLATIDASLYHHLRGFEGKRVRILVEVVK